MVFSVRLKKARLEKKMTQEELGKKINVTKVSVSGYESGNRTPDMETLQKLATVLDISLDYLLGRTDNPSPTDNKDLDEWGLTEDDSIFFKDFAGLSEEEKLKVKEHLRYIKHLAEQKNKE